jgi:hypothetical protein
MGVLHFAVNHKRKEIYVLGKTLCYFSDPRPLTLGPLKGATEMPFKEIVWLVVIGVVGAAGAITTGAVLLSLIGHSSLCIR